MPKLRKQRRKKVYKHNVNRKRLRNKIFNTGNIKGCEQVENAWDHKKSAQTNLEQMGLSYDPNITLAIPKRKNQLKEALGLLDKEWHVEDVQDNVQGKIYVAKALEADAKAPRERRFRLPKSQVEWVTYLMKKYKKDYRAMARDSKNYYQETWKQLRQKIRMFKKIPEQYNKYLEENGLQLTDSEDDVLSDDEL